MNVFTIVTGNFAENTYIIANENSSDCCVIDPGEDRVKIDGFLEQHSFNPKAILLTHGHFDHIEAVNFLRKKYLCPVFAYKDEYEMLTSPEKNLSSSFCSEPIVIESPEKLLSDNESFSVAGLDFTVIHTPGHSKGSVVYRCDNLLFSGDTLFNGCCGRCDLWGGNTKEMKASLDRIFAERENLIVYPGHDLPTTLDKERTVYKFFI